MDQLLASLLATAASSSSSSSSTAAGGGQGTTGGGGGEGPMSQDQLQVILKILEENRKLKEEERKGKEIQLQILKVLSQNANLRDVTSVTNSDRSAPSIATPDLNALLGLTSPSTSSNQFDPAYLQNLGLDAFTDSSTDFLKMLESPGMDQQQSSEPGLNGFTGSLADLTDVKLVSMLDPMGNLRLGSMSMTADSKAGISNLTSSFDALTNGNMTASPSLGNQNIGVVGSGNGRMGNDGVDVDGSPSYPMFDSTALMGLDSLPDEFNFGDEDVTDFMNRFDSMPNDTSNEMGTLLNYRTISATPPLSFDDDGPKKKPYIVEDHSEDPLLSRLRNPITMVTPLVVAERAESPTRTPKGHHTTSSLAALTTPTDVFVQAAAKASTRRRTVEEPAFCTLCNEHIGSLQLRGTPRTFEAYYVVDMKCMACAEGVNNSATTGIEATSTETVAHESAEGSSSSLAKGRKGSEAGLKAGSGSAASMDGGKRRKRVREIPTIECEVCKRVTAQGSVKKAVAVQDGDAMDGATSPSLSTNPAISGNVNVTWTEPDFAVELVCKSCSQRYMFCSECGGGGKSRTGKWRPKELFEMGRRTCSLPHIRIGDATVQHRVLETPAELTPSLLHGVRDVFFDCLVSLYAIPSIMETPRFNGSIARVREEVEDLWTRTALDALTSVRPTSLGDGKIYLTVAWIDKRHRNKGKGIAKKDKDKEAVPWLMRLALEGTVAPLKPLPDIANPAANSSSAPSSSVGGTTVSVSTAGPMDTAGAVASGGGVWKPPNDPAISSVGEGVDRVHVAFAVSEWDRPRGSLFMVQMAPRSIFLPTMESYGELIRRGVERVQADVRRDNAPPLEHLWCWTRNEHARLQAIPERLGFVPVEQYIRANPMVDRSTFMREGYAPLAEEGVSIYVTSVKDFLKLTGKGVGKKGRQAGA
ncbi:hypothetical protein HDU76_003107 [Blyttiomyces sp. JEL0837]|nr:hypothetical protein HDU76_003107 [Blyttiomyces sp. JEL0837]